MTAAIEQMIQDKGLTAPRVTPAQIEALAARIVYRFDYHHTSTMCHAFLDGTFYLCTGHSACVSLDNYNLEIGNRFAQDDATNKARKMLWLLEGYALRKSLGNDKSEWIAKVCHEVNRAYCQSLGDNSQPVWADDPGWQRASERMGVDLHTMGDFGPEASHISWMSQKLDEGWKYGPLKDAEKKEHPCMVPFADLPVAQQAKDYIFRAVVHALR